MDYARNNSLLKDILDHDKCISADLSADRFAVGTQVMSSAQCRFTGKQRR